ncbi:hypothetical protein EV363DRAFT_1172103, partial [Boletus edulis]
RDSPSSAQELHHRSEVQAPFPSGQTRCCAIMMVYITCDPPVIHCTSTRRYQREHQMTDEDEQSCLHHIVRSCRLNRDGV